MRLDHVSYVASHDQISNVVNRIGSQIGTAFVDGGIHPKFGTRNFTAPLINNQYIEVVCPMDHPATDSTPFGRAVKKKADEGGGWMTWVLAVDDISETEKVFKRNSVDGVRKKPDGTLLNWKQIGVLEVLEDSKMPFFIQWVSTNHPSKDGISVAQLNKIIINGKPKDLFFQLKLDLKKDINGTEIVWEESKNEENSPGINFIEIKLKDEIIQLF
jgi:hypothetical protein